MLVILSLIFVEDAKIIYGYHFVALNLESFVSCPYNKSSCSFAAALSFIHLPSPPQFHDLESPFVVVLYTKPICSDAWSLYLVKTFSNFFLKKFLYIGKLLSGHFWGHQWFSVKNILVLDLRKIENPEKDTFYSSETYFLHFCFINCERTAYAVIFFYFLLIFSV